MVAHLPVPIEFQLPAGWQSAPPEEARDPQAAFYAVHPEPGDSGYTANITISGELRNDAATLPEIADESIEELKQHFPTGQLAERRDIGTPQSPGLTQVLRLRDHVDNTEHRLLQVQVFLSMHDTGDPRQRAVIRVTLTAAADQFERLVGEFQRFLNTVRPA